MLDSLRNAAGSWISKLLLAMLIVSFAIWGITGRMLGTLTESNTVVQAGSTHVGVNDYMLAYRRAISVMEQRLGQRLTPEQADALGLDDQVLSQLVAGAVLDEQAREMGLGVSSERLARLVREDPAFRGPDGTYDKQQFEYVLRQVGMRPEDYLRNREQVAVRQQIVEAVANGLVVPDVFLKAVALYRGEDRTADYVVLPRTMVEPVADPAADVLTTWFDGRKADYAAPEYRKISYARLEPADIADPAAISDEQVKADYDKNIARYTTPEKRQIDQLVFADEAAARTAEETIKGGSTFDDIVLAQGKTAADVAMGTLARAEVADKAIAEAAFGLTEGGVSGVIAGAFGPVIVRVAKIEPEIVRPFDAVKDEIRKELALAEAQQVLLDAHDAYEDARASGDTLVEAAAKVKIKVVTVDAVSRTGQAPDGSVVSDIPESEKLLAAAFETDVGVENAGLATANSGFVFFEVDAVTPARDRTLDEVRERVVADWKREEAASLLSARAEAARKSLDGGATLDAVATETGQTKQTKRGLKRDAEDADLGEAGVTAVFAVKPGGHGVFAGPNGDSQILFVVTEATEPAGAGPEMVPDEVRQTFAAAMSDDLLDQLVNRLRGQYEVTVNQAAIDVAKRF